MVAIKSVLVLTYQAFSPIFDHLSAPAELLFTVLATPLHASKKTNNTRSLYYRRNRLEDFEIHACHQSPS